MPVPSKKKKVQKGTKTYKQKYTDLFLKSTDKETISNKECISQITFMK
jgi:hypothetical protein